MLTLAQSIVQGCVAVAGDADRCARRSCLSRVGLVSCSDGKGSIMFARVAASAFDSSAWQLLQHLGNLFAEMPVAMPSLTVCTLKRNLEGDLQQPFS